MKQFMNVFGFHFKESALSKASLISMAITFIGTIAVIGGIYWFGGSEEDVNIAIIQNSENFVIDVAELNEKLEDVNFIEEKNGNLDDLRLDIEEGYLENIFIINGDEVPAITSIHQNSSHFESEMLITQLLHQKYLARVMGENEVLPEVVEQLLTPILVNNEPLRDQMEVAIGTGIAFAFGWVLYMILIICGQVVANGIVSEKSSRVMEVMISKVKPVYMMYAKILVALTSIFALVLPAVGGAFVANTLGWFNLDDIFELLATLEIDGRLIVFGIIFLVLGYLLYTTLFAAAGAMCTNTEMLGTVTSPLIMAVLIPMLVPSFLPDDSIVMTIMSYIPFFSPFVTFNRMATGMATNLEVGISISILIITIGILGKLATRVYINGVMRYSEKVTFKDLKQLLQRQ